MTDRNTFIQYIRAALIAQRPDFAQKLADNWLAIWPGDAEVKLLRSSALYEQDRFELCVSELEALIIQDPELSNAYRLLAKSVRHVPAKSVTADLYDSCLRLLSRRPIQARQMPTWVTKTADAYQSLDSQDLDKAAASISQALTAEPTLPLTLLA
ncbi:MAG: hypothetical protein PVF49_09950, partial [Anaerolineales bacterium]